LSVVVVSHQEILIYRSTRKEQTNEEQERVKERKEANQEPRRKKRLRKETPNNKKPKEIKQGQTFEPLQT
jgi:hypothetical protein